MVRNRTARRVASALVALALVSLNWSGAPVAASPGSPTRPANHNYSAAQVVQFNMYGGNGNATTGYNTQVAPAIVNSIKARNPYPFIVGLNEVCEAQYAHMSWVLAADGYGYNPGNPWGYSSGHTISLGDFFGSQVGNVPPTPACGAWYGNALFMRGGFTGGGGSGWYEHQRATNSGEKRNWLCQTTGGPSVCITHLDSGPSIQTFAQAGTFRDIANYVSAAGVYALGDFNYVPTDPNGSTDRFWWAATGFSEADGCCASRSTSDYGHLDYIWRKNLGGWPHPAYIANSNYSDHHWYQGYM